MAISVFDLFTVGIGPSSSHTVGPMRAAKRFVEKLIEHNLLSVTQRVTLELYGSLALTGIGHGTDIAIMLGLLGESPEQVVPEMISQKIANIKNNQVLSLQNISPIKFRHQQDIIFHPRETLPYHANGMRFTAYGENNHLHHQDTFYSIGGGFIVDGTESTKNKDVLEERLPHVFTSAKTLLQRCAEKQITIAQLMWENEITLQDANTVRERLHFITETMLACIARGCETQGILPGGLNIARRAPSFYEKLMRKGPPQSYEHTDSMAWLNLFAIAVNEENAAGSRVVTAPTNGAAGIVPAVLKYYLSFYPQAKKEDAIPYLLTAAAIALLYKKGASLSGAEVGCQGEVGVACSMAAAALTALLGGSIYQIENAAEIAMEHHLGMTCDPIQGLVQIPCIERNAMGAVKAVNAARLALLGDGQHYVSLDKVIATMKQTGIDMMSIYKETSLGGLAVNIPEC